MFELWFLNAHRNWNYVDALNDYAELVEACNQLTDYARVIVQSGSSSQNTALDSAYSHRLTSGVTVSFIEPNKTMTTSE